jgi:DNA-binding GntR family transcriptional regulator
MARLQPVSASSLRERVAAAIRHAIFSGQFGPGDALRELHLAKDLQVGQSTVREALLELEGEGLVIRTPNIGTAVTNMSSVEARERLILRQTLEVMAFVDASRNMGRPERDELNRRLDQIAAEVAANAYYEAARADLAFHAFIWECSGNRVLARTLRQITAPLFAFASMLRSTGSEDLSSAVNSHVPLVRAVRSGDAARIDRAIRAHLANSYDAFLQSGAEDCRSYAETHRVRRAGAHS